MEDAIEIIEEVTRDADKAVTDIAQEVERLTTQWRTVLSAIIMLISIALFLYVMVLVFRPACRLLFFSEPKGSLLQLLHRLNRNNAY